MLWCCISAHLYKQQGSIVKIAVAKVCYEASLQSITEQWGSYFALTSAAVPWCFIPAQVWSDPATTHCSTVQGQIQSPLFSVALQNRLTAGSPSPQLHLWRFALHTGLPQQQSSAARFRAKCNPHCSVLLCKTGSQQAVCHCSYTCGDLLFTQVCMAPAPMHCSSVQGKLQPPLFKVALKVASPC